MPALAPPCAGRTPTAPGRDASRAGLSLRRLRSPCAAAVSAPDGPSPAELNAEFGVPNRVEVTFGVAGMLRVGLQHRNGRRAPPLPPPGPLPLTWPRSCAGVYLHGANVTSWRISNGSEVLFLRPDTPLDGIRPIRHATASPPRPGR